jgi:hypothetical protein
VTPNCFRQPVPRAEAQLEAALERADVVRILKGREAVDSSERLSALGPVCVRVKVHHPGWWALPGSNRRPAGCKPAALAN